MYKETYGYFHFSFGKLTHTIRCQLNLTVVELEYRCRWGWSISLWVTRTKHHMCFWYLSHWDYWLLLWLPQLAPVIWPQGLLWGLSGWWYYPITLEIGIYPKAKVIIVLSDIFLLKLARKKAEYFYNYLFILIVIYFLKIQVFHLFRPFILAKFFYLSILSKFQIYWHKEFKIFSYYFVISAVSVVMYPFSILIFIYISLFSWSILLKRFVNLVFVKNQILVLLRIMYHYLHVNSFCSYIYYFLFLLSAFFYF